MIDAVFPPRTHVSGRKSGIKCNSARHPTVTNSKQRRILGLRKPSVLFVFAPNKVDWPFRCSHVAEDSDLLHTVCTVFGSAACTHQPPGAVPRQERLVRGQEHHADSRTHWMSAALHPEQVRFTADRDSGVWADSVPGHISVRENDRNVCKTRRLRAEKRIRLDLTSFVTIWVITL